MKVLIGGQIEKGGTVNFCIKAFKKCEVGIEVVDFNKYFRLSFINRVINKFLSTPHYFGVKKLNLAVVEKVNETKPDFVLFFKPTLIFPETIKELKKHTKVFSWYPDYVLFPKTASTFFYKSIPLYDAHLSFNFANVEELKKFGAENSIFLPCAADSECHSPVKVDKEEKEKLGADVVFIGTYAHEKRSEYLEQLCRDGYDIKIYGNDWQKHPRNSYLWRKGCIQSRALYCRDMSKILNASKITLAFVREHNKETLACRTYEIPACGAFLLHERTSKTHEVFQEGKEADFFSSYEEMKKKIDFYLENEELRKNIAENGRERILRDGLFVNRVNVIVEIFKNLQHN